VSVVPRRSACIVLQPGRWSRALTASHARGDGGD
jgi:hypothetical protein